MSRMLLRTHHSHLGNDATRGRAGRARALSIGGNIDLLAGNDTARGGARGAGALVVGGDVNLGEGDDDGGRGEGVHCEYEEVKARERV